MTMATETRDVAAPCQTDPTWQLPTPLRRPLLLLPPLLLAGLEVLHPSPDVNAQAVLDVATWFTVFHVIQLALIGTVGLSFLLLAASFGRASAWTTRLGIGVFLMFFSSYDTLAGIGTGLAMRSARDLSTAEQEVVFEVVKDWPGVGPPFALSVIGTVGWMVAAGALALHARRPYLGAGRGPARLGHSSPRRCHGCLTRAAT
jgi:hypothetical protein